MTIALATRGYIYPRTCVQILQGEGPSIVGSVVAQPSIDGALAVLPAGPELVGSVTPGPVISGASGPGTVELEPPFISGSETPKIG